jgi:hypothetical protein
VHPAARKPQNPKTPKPHRSFSVDNINLINGTVQNS